jgi:hypothetical protein
MATNNPLDSSYAGKYAGEYIRSAFQANDSLNYVTFRPNVDWREVVKKLVDDVDFEAPNCSFTPLGDVAISERFLTIKKFQVQREICKNKYLDDWTAKDAQNGNLETALTDNLIANMLEGIASANENKMWTGSDSTTSYDGLLTLIGNDVDGDVNFVSTPVAITTSNVFTETQRVIDALPVAVKQSTEKPIIYYSNDVWEKFMFASAAAGNGWYTYGGAEVPKMWLGMYQIAVCSGLPANTILMTQKSNLWFGTNVESDWNNILVKDMGEFGEDNVRFSAKFFAGAQYGIGSKISVASLWF